MDFLKKINGYFKKENKKINNITSDVNVQYSQRTFEAAKQSHSQDYWQKTSVSMDANIYTSLPRLRACSRQLANDDALMTHYLGLMATNIVGPGFKNQIEGRDTNGKLDKIGNELVSKAWKDWMLKENCDVSKKLNFAGIQTLVEKIQKRDGECIIKFIRSQSSKKNKYGFQLQILDVDRLDINLMKTLNNGNAIRMGVELDQYGAPVAYYINKYESKDNASVYTTVSSTDYERVLEKDMVHYFEIQSAEQTRGFPAAHSVMNQMQHLKEFDEACLIAAKIGAASSLYLETEPGVGTNQIADKQEENGDFVAEIGYGEIRKLPPGAKMKSFDANYPSDAYQVFTKRLLQKIAGGLNISPVFLANDAQDLNYSTARTIVVEERNYYKNQQQHFIDNFLNKVYEAWLEQALLNGCIKTATGATIGADKLEKFKAHTFIGRTWDAVDQKKEQEALDMAYKGMRKPLSEIIAEDGKDFNEVMERYKQDNEIMKQILGEDFKLNPTNSNNESNQQEE